jgi:hypothetical protein
VLGEAIGIVEAWRVVEGTEMPPPTTACYQCGGRKLGKVGKKAWRVAIVQVVESSAALLEVNKEVEEVVERNMKQ